KFGWGLLNTRGAADLLSSNLLSAGLPFLKEVRLFDGDYVEFPMTATNGTPRLKVTICWTDPSGAEAPRTVNPTNLTLVNDLDLRIISPSGVTNFPWVLNPVSPTNLATHADNFRDNVEQVIITNAAAGTYLVRITHKGHIVNEARSNATQWVSIIT